MQAILRIIKQLYTTVIDLSGGVIQTIITYCGDLVGNNIGIILIFKLKFIFNKINSIIFKFILYKYHNILMIFSMLFDLYFYIYLRYFGASSTLYHFNQYLLHKYNYCGKSTNTINVINKHYPNQAILKDRKERGSVCYKSSWLKLDIKLQQSYLLPFILEIFNIKLPDNASNEVIAFFNLGLLGLICLLSFINIIGYILAIYYFNKLTPTLQQKYPFLKKIVNYYEKISIVYIIIESVVCLMGLFSITLICFTRIGFFIFH